MRKVFILIFLSYQLCAFDNKTASKILDKIFHAIIKKEQISIYTVNDIYKKVVSLSSTLVLSDDEESADIILIDSFSEIPPDSNGKIFFSTSYLVFQENDDTVGAFYWDRGHIKIEFSKERLNQKNITLPEIFNKYIKDKIND